MTIKIHDLRPAPGAKTAKTRVGRGEGGKGGKTAGRGTKGTGARKNVPAGFEGGQMPLHMRLPKLKGFRNRFRVEYQVVNVGDLGTLFPDGGTVGPEELAEVGAVRKKPVKVLGDGDLRRRAERSARTRSPVPPATRSPLRAARSPSCSRQSRARGAGGDVAQSTARTGTVGPGPCQSRRCQSRLHRRSSDRRCDGGLAGRRPCAVSTGGCRCSALSGRP